MSWNGRNPGTEFPLPLDFQPLHDDHPVLIFVILGAPLPSQHPPVSRDFFAPAALAEPTAVPTPAAEYTRTTANGLFTSRRHQWIDVQLWRPR